MFLIQLFERLIFIPCFKSEYRKGVYKKPGQNVILWFCENAAWWYCGDFSGMFPKKIKILSSDEIKALLRGAPFTIHALSEFEVLIFFLYTMSCFSSVGLRFLKCSKIGHTRRWGLLTREITSSKQSLAVWVSARTRATTMMRCWCRCRCRWQCFKCQSRCRSRCRSICRSPCPHFPQLLGMSEVWGIIWLNYHLPSSWSYPFNKDCLSLTVSTRTPPLPSTHPYLHFLPPLLLYLPVMHTLFGRLQVYVSVFMFPLSQLSTLRSASENQEF